MCVCACVRARTRKFIQGGDLPDLLPQKCVDNINAWERYGTTSEPKVAHPPHHLGITFAATPIAAVAERLSRRQIILHRISAIVMYVYVCTGMYPSHFYGKLM